MVGSKISLQCAEMELYTLVLCLGVGMAVSVVVVSVPDSESSSETAVVAVVKILRTKTANQFLLPTSSPRYSQPVTLSSVIFFSFHPLPGACKQAVCPF